MRRKILLGLLPFSCFTSIAQEQPNVILIMADDLGWGDVGFNGSKIVKTPNLDKLANDGIVFERFYSGCSVSSPTRASVLTGRNPFRTGVFHANVGILRPEETTIPELLQQQGYMTGHFGKWHLGTLTYKIKDANRGKPGNTELYNIPAEHGYIESFVTESKVPTCDPMIKPLKCNNGFWDYIENKNESVSYNTHYWKHNGEIETENLSGDDSKIIMDRVLPFIDYSCESERPFFSMIWFHTPHLPCVASPEYANMYKDKSLNERNYYGCITAMDHQIGRLIQYLKDKNIYDNTIICFCSDNGPEVNTPGTAGSLRGRKRDMYEGGIRVPSLVVYPAGIKGGQRTDHIASTSDYLPTLVDFLGLREPSYIIDGESLVPFFKEGKDREKPLVIALQKNATVIEQRYKLVSKKGKDELYDISEDPSEKTDISTLKPEITSRLRKYLDKEIESFRRSFIGEEYGTRSYNKVKQEWSDIK